MKNKLKFICYYYFVSFKAISLGVSLWFDPFNIEIHLPFGFVRIGWEEERDKNVLNYKYVNKRSFGVK